MLDDLTKAPVVMTVGDKQYEVSPLTHGDFGSLLRFIAFEPLTMLKEAGASPEALDKCLTECAAKKIVPGGPEFDQAFMQPSVQLETVFLSLRHKQPNITRDQVRDFDYSDSMVLFSVAVIISGSFPKSQGGASKKERLEVIKQQFPSLFAG